MNNKKQNTIIWLKASIITILFCVLIILSIVLFRNENFVAATQHNTNIEAEIPTSTYIADVEPTNTPTPVITSEPTPEPFDPYVIAWLCDTQGYSAYKPKIFSTMATWIVDNAEAMNIQYVLHTGDIVDSCDSPRQWENAQEALSILDDHVPLFTVAGNHDINSGEHEYASYLKYFGQDRYSGLDTYGGSYRDGRGRYDLININGQDVIMITIGYSVVSKDIEWVNETLEQYSDRTAILCVHGYMAPDGSFTCDGRILYPDVVAVNSNLKLVLCGHRHGNAHNTVMFDDDGDGVEDRRVDQVLFNSQTSRDYGGGYLRLVSFDSQANEIRFTAYSPYYDESSELEEFSIPWS